MKKLFYLSIFFFFSTISISFAQWPLIYGQEYYWAYPNHIRETYDKGFMFTYDYELSPNTAYASGIIKTDINGNILWGKILENDSKYIQIKGITMDNDNNILICGSTCQYDEVRDPFVMKLNPCMEPEWCNIYHSPGLDDLANEIVFVQSSNSFIIDFHYDRTQERVKLMNIDNNGEIVWENYFCTDTAYMGTLPQGIVHSDSDSSIVLYGFTYVYDSSFEYYKLEPYLLKTKVNGDFIWEFYTIADTSFLYGLTSRKPLFINQFKMLSPAISSTEKTSLLVDINYASGSYNNSIYLHHPDSIIYCIVNASGNTSDRIFTGVQYFETGYDAIGNASLQAYDTLGNFINEAILPMNFTSVIYDICNTHDDKIVISANNDYLESDMVFIKYNQNLEYDSIYSLPLSYDSLCSTGISTGTIQMSCNIITSLPVHSGNGIPTLKFVPNAADEYTVVYLPETILSNFIQGAVSVTSYKSDYVKSLSMEVYDINGQRIFKSHWPDNTKEQVLNISNWKPGLYIVRICNNQRVISTGKLMVK